MRQRFLLALRIWFGAILLILQIWGWNLSFSPFNPATPVANNIAAMTVLITSFVIGMAILITIADILTGTNASGLRPYWDEFLNWLDKHD